MAEQLQRGTSINLEEEGVANYFNFIITRPGFSPGSPFYFFGGGGVITQQSPGQEVRLSTSPGKPGQGGVGDLVRKMLH